MTEQLRVIVGAGPVGTALARMLRERGDRVRVLTRSGRDTGIAGVESIAVDAAEPAALAAQTRGAQTLFNCANPGSYPQWEREWPPLASSILQAAESSGAVLVTVSNLYAYGPDSGTMTRESPLRPSDHKGALRARMWDEALTAHRAGRVRVTELRSSDYIGPTVTASGGLLAMYAQKTLVGKTATVFSDPDQPHTWTAIDDVAATLVALAGDERAWGEAWITPSNAPRTVRDALRALGAHVGAGEPHLRLMPRWVLTAGGAAVPLLRELRGVLYQFDAPFVADGSATTDTFGIRPTPWDTIIAQTADAWSARAR